MSPDRSDITRAVPWPLVAVGCLGLGLVIAPEIGLIAGLHWTSAVGDLAAAESLAALRLSLYTSLVALAIAAALGVPIALLLARVRLGYRSLLRAVVAVPIVLPPTVAGVALLLAFGRRGLFGGALSFIGVDLPLTTGGAILAETFVAMPFMVLSVEAGLRALDPAHAEAAATLGAGPWRRLSTVTLPLLLPSLGAGAALTWARALGEFGATITFAGDIPGRTQTVPLAVYVLLAERPASAAALSVLLLAVSMTVLVVFGRRLFR